MRVTIFMAGLMLAGLGLLAVSPGGMAVGTCTSATDDDCGQWLVCIGKSTTSWGGVECQYGIHEPVCPYSHPCPPPP